MIIYAWAFEQHDGRSKHRFASQDVLVPWHLRTEARGAPGDDGEDASARERAAAIAAESRGRFENVYQRYCHVYREGELEALMCSAGEPACLRVDETYYDAGNWCVVATKTKWGSRSTS